ncbi:MAG: hypothetical protein ABEK84_00815 [Salinibacter sp.]
MESLHPLGALFLLGLFAPAPAMGQETLDPRGTLASLSGVTVRADVSTTARGLRESDLKTDLERRLQKAGIEVYDDASDVQSGAAPILLLEVTTYKSERLFSYCADLKLYQKVRLHSGDYAIANTYSAGNYIGMVRAAGLDTLGKEIRRLAGQFIQDWRSAHRPGARDEPHSRGATTGTGASG